ncbi:Beta-N-acetylhexosaminidase [Candidatus Koribacter versatilis Ellin345]|uniref:beta-N-acetylhexosaminidase n=1 Tax=Koribacter versatilis (strain Ellin345) TaxID=204669 RepID=Q1IQ59_KORVE|nr:beta-N-acetylhexosaminidase [Candidatus Koribacter versatilis]ABF40991.1 Beta-N-acetylhexosaminidase [Candidatus Koribacter versatilis Ellin345]
MASTRLQELQQQVGQLMIVGFDGTEMSARVRTLLATIQPAGTIFFKRNVATAEQTWKLNYEAQAAVSTPLFRCVDLEGGTVDRLRDAVAPAPSLSNVAATGSKKVMRRFARTLAAEARALGFNTDFAPVFDLRTVESVKVLAGRTIAADPKHIIELAREFLKGFKDENVLGCGKHFPGLGAGAVDSHYELPTISKPWKALWEEDLLPYRKLKDEIAFAMVAHCVYPNATKEKAPASISRFWMTDILRKKIGFKHLICSDDMEMKGVQKAVSIEEACIQAVRGGADLFLVCNNESLVWRCFHAVLREAERDKSFAKQIAAASRRVFEFKKRSRAVRAKFNPAPTLRTVDKLRRTIWELTEEVRYSSPNPERAL